jgi:hypothetical protein
MKTILLATLLAISLTAARAQNAPSYFGTPVNQEFDETSQFIFFSVLEGLYADGLSNADVDQILMKREGESYFHFIYACPICTATIWALETYRARPEKFYGLKSNASTFGPGLSGELKTQLYSPESNQRLLAINTLVHDWMLRRMDAMNLPAGERKTLLKEIEVKRKDGMDSLKNSRKGGTVATMAPAYADLEECAACNGAVGKPIKLPFAKPKK